MFDPRIPPEPVSDWRFAFVREAAQYMYHVSPRDNRESIQQGGLTGHDLKATQSPWEQKVGQPPGNYMFETPTSAKQYVGALAMKQHGGMYPGDMRPVPEHPGYDVWRVNVSGLPMTHDPEEYLVNKRMMPNHHELYRDWDFPMWNDNEYGISQARWVTPNHVENHRLDLHDHIPAHEIDDEWAEETHHDIEDELLPATALQLHPRLVNPKGTVPPELRHIWGHAEDWDLTGL